MKAIDLLLPEQEQGMFNSGWRIRVWSRGTRFAGANEVFEEEEEEETHTGGVEHLDSFVHLDELPTAGGNGGDGLDDGGNEGDGRGNALAEKLQTSNTPASDLDGSAPLVFRRVRIQPTVTMECMATSVRMRNGCETVNTLAFVMLSFRATTTTLVFLFCFSKVFAADCQTATVGSPYSTCWDIAVAAGINIDQLNQYNPGLDCAAIQPGQKLCITVGDLPSTAPSPNPDGSCAQYTTVAGDYCALIGTTFGITAAQIEQFNINTYKWRGCANLQVGFTLCVSTGTPPPIPVNPALQCGPESPGAAECPLKACCSPFGYCGITSEFCEASPSGEPCISNCGYATIPSCDGSQLTRHVGYYAGWSATRDCNPVTVSQLDLTGLTHVIYAFASIGEDMTISFEDLTDGDRLRELVTKAGSNTKVMVAVGGWTFSQGATKDRFSTMIGDAANRATFITSVNAFISSYEIAGIDIDFEYPASIERNGPPSDTPNLTLFFTELRTNLGTSALISIATPAGYWFLKGFELDKISPEVSFFNMMSYDYHGPWDTTVPGANSTVQPQSSLLDIQDSVRLYVKAGVDMNKVNLGLPWYGRTYELNDTSCAGYNCDMKGGGVKGLCSNESGVLANFEINQVIMDADVRPRLDTASQTLWFKHGNDIITYDDNSTLAAKSDFAKSSCFGGTMIWSIDQNIPADTANPGTGIAFPVISKAVVSNPYGAQWEVPTAGSCTSYGTRMYTARLWYIPSGIDWMTACESSPVVINGVHYAVPDKCEDQGIWTGAVGTWFVSSTDPHCMAHWGSMTDDGCVDNGVRKYYRQVLTRLWGIASGVDWMIMCKSTPATVGGVNFDSPFECDDKAIFGAWGVWHVDDTTCLGTWGNLKDNGCADEPGKREWSSKLLDIVGSWEDACNTRDNTVEDEYFATPSVCEKHITGIWGVFKTMDTLCGVPPCPNNRVWDYDTGSCMDCSGAGRLIAPRRIHDRVSANGSIINHSRGLEPNFKDERRRSLHGNSTHIHHKRIKECLPFHLPRPSPVDLLNNALAWPDINGAVGSQAEGPSVQEIVGSPQALARFQEAWNDSFPTRNTAREAGGWIYADPANPSRIMIRRAQLNRANSMNRLHPPNVAAGINLNSPESNPGTPAPAGWVLVANFHTHPMGDAYGGNPSVPSTADNSNAWFRGVPGIIIHPNGLTAYGPTRRAMLNAPRGYPNTNDPYNGQGSAGTRVGSWSPDPAPNQ
ncbi:hypothetical protein D9615_008102 [Tricholomella constricta]|uniref:Chitinase n=1 Tax=Tricholomella constricta TaxID=117010 RepID=A0A8H5GVC1_9AGAR|nr:hypothetical protein D9615_008102 [Tricholomella constricta]